MTKSRKQPLLRVARMRQSQAAEDDPRSRVTLEALIEALEEAAIRFEQRNTKPTAH